MDAVSIGLIGGSAGGMLIVLGGAIMYTGNAFPALNLTLPVFVWLILLTAICVFQLFLTFTLTQTYIAPPTGSVK